MFKSLLTFLLLVPAIASADSFYVEEPRERSDASVTVERLVKNELLSRGHTVVTNDVNPQWVLIPDAIKLGNSYIVSLTKLKDGRVVYSDKLKSASLDNLDTVSARLVSGALDNVASENSITVDTVTENEAAGTAVKTRVTRQKFLGYGPSAPNNLGVSNSGVMFTAGALWGVDHQVSIRAGYTTSNVSESPADMTGVNIGGHYYLNREQHSPYAVGLLGYTWAESHTRNSENTFSFGGEKESGWSIEAGMGMHFYRTAKVNIAAEVTYNQAIFDMTEGAPGALGAKLIVLF